MVEICSVMNNTPVGKDELRYPAVLIIVVVFSTQNSFSTHDVICFFFRYFKLIKKLLAKST